jgi:hypothetical protein
MVAGTDPIKVFTIWDKFKHILMHDDMLCLSQYFVRILGHYTLKYLQIRLHLFEIWSEGTLISWPILP